VNQVTPGGVNVEATRPLETTVTLTRITTTIACALLTTACGAATTPKPTQTVTVTAPATSAGAAKKPAAVKPAPAKKVRIPNVVGKNHQAAQDYLQSKGFYALAEKDATGQGRLLIWDRNWEVVRQTPKAGTLADPGKVTITLYSKKIGE
jgi:hypothetical protein